MLELLPERLRSTRHAGITTLAVAVAAFAAYVGWELSVNRLLERAPPLVWPDWIVNSIVLFVAATISSVVGFAFSAIAGAFMLHLVSSNIEAVQIMMIASVGIQAYSVRCLRAAIEWRRCGRFVLGGVVTLPIGVWLLLSLQPRTYLSAVGVMLMGYGLYMLRRRTTPILIHCPRWTDTLIGALGGITGPLAALPGVWLTIWCGMRGWTKVEQRAVYQPYILVMQILGIAALCLTQRRSAPDPAILAYVLPGLAGAMIGLRVFHALSDRQFQKVLNVALVISGLALALK